MAAELTLGAGETRIGGVVEALVSAAAHVEDEADSGRGFGRWSGVGGPGAACGKERQGDGPEDEEPADLYRAKAHALLQTAGFAVARKLRERLAYRRDAAAVPT